MDVSNGGSFDPIGRYDIVEPAMSMEEGNLPICDIISWCPAECVRQRCTWYLLYTRLNQTAGKICS